MSFQQASGVGSQTRGMLLQVRGIDLTEPRCDKRVLAQATDRAKASLSDAAKEKGLHLNGASPLTCGSRELGYLWCACDFAWDLA